MSDGDCRILGIDPGTRSTGYGVLIGSGSDAAHVVSGTIRTRGSGTIAGRLKTIYEGLLSLMAEYRPTAIAIEGTFMDKNSQSAMKLGQARGIALLAAEQSDIPVLEYAPAQVKLAVVGYGGATKDQVRVMVARLLNMREGPESEDAADALAVALCHFHSAKWHEISKAGAPALARPSGTGA